MIFSTSISLITGSSVCRKVRTQPCNALGILPAQGGEEYVMLMRRVSLILMRLIIIVTKVQPGHHFYLVLLYYPAVVDYVLKDACKSLALVDGSKAGLVHLVTLILLHPTTPFSSRGKARLVHDSLRHSQLI